MGAADAFLSESNIRLRPFLQNIPVTSLLDLLLYILRFLLALNHYVRVFLIQCVAFISNMIMTYLFRNRSLSEDSRPISSHGPVTVHQRPRSEWCNDEHHSHSLITRSRVGFKNPWKSFHKPTFWEVASGASLRKTEQTAHTVDERDPVEVAQESLEAVQPSWGAPWNQTSSQGQIRATWLGHAGVLVQFPSRPDAVNDDGVNVLVDPIFSERSSPAKWAGPTRIVETPCSTTDLPPIHVLIISHNQ